jgi:hypothetical protein
MSEENDINDSQPTGEIEEEEYEEYASTELLIVRIIFSTILVALVVSVWGLIWTIGDAIQPDGKFQSFLELSALTKTMIIGVGLLGLVFLGIFMAVVYRRGRDWMLEALFLERPKPEGEEYPPAKIITACCLIAVCWVATGLIIALIQEIAALWADASIFNALTEWSGGLSVLVVGLTGLLIAALAFVFIYLWLNGYVWVINTILRYNQAIPEDTHEYNQQQLVGGQVIFAVVAGGILLVVGGIVWAIADALQPTGKWETFQTYGFGIQFTIVGGMLSVLFFALIGLMTGFRFGTKTIRTALFVKKEIPAELKGKVTSTAKALAIAVLAAIFLIIFPLVAYLISVAFQLDDQNIFESLAAMSGGLRLLLIGVVVLVFTILGIGAVFVINNGYYEAMKRIMAMETTLDSTLGGEGKSEAEASPASSKAPPKKPKKPVKKKPVKPKRNYEARPQKLNTDQ